MLEQFITSVQAKTPQEIEQNAAELVGLLADMDITDDIRKKMVLDASKIAHITDSVTTRTAFLRSYYRIHKNGVKSDGRAGSAVIEITRHCPKHCPNCYLHASDNRMISDDALDAILKYIRHHCKHIFLTGGEPLTDKRVFRLAADNPDIVFFVFSNGMLIDLSMAQTIAGLGNLITILGIDGDCAAMHDGILKGANSFDEVNRAIDNLNAAKAAWGYLSVVTRLNATTVLSPEFVLSMRRRGAIMARYLEFMPTGKKADLRLFPSAQDYWQMEKRKREIIERNEIYLQDTSQNKCRGLLFFSADGSIKNCPFFHYAKHNVAGGHIREKVADTIRDWCLSDHIGECPLYSAPIRFRQHLSSCGWKPTVNFEEEYLTNPETAETIAGIYQSFLNLKSREHHDS
ncbi:MAG: radical SAM protein [Lentisphaerae bacterium]|nr:radical SAM protein [Lentisphaerota bacterium]